MADRAVSQFLGRTYRFNSSGRYTCYISLYSHCF